MPGALLYGVLPDRFLAHAQLEVHDLVGAWFGRLKFYAKGVNAQVFVDDHSTIDG